jgi:two-component system, OmpR family, alkaline phosphatase synthesis response regulator PhoP
VKQRTILVIEDDPAIRRGLVDALAFAGYRPLEAADGVQGRSRAVTVDCDLVLLDLVLPGADGLEILAVIRAARPTLPVIIMTARGGEDDRTRGLELGADDYVVKPFSIKELVARVAAVLRRSAERPADVHRVAIPGGRIDLERSEVVYDSGGRTDLTERDREVVRYLAANAGRTVSREEILTRVWRIDPDRVETRTVDMHIARLREKLAAPGQSAPVIETVRGKGYRWAPVTGETD